MAGPDKKKGAVGRHPTGVERCQKLLELFQSGAKAGERVSGLSFPITSIYYIPFRLPASKKVGTARSIDRELNLDLGCGLWAASLKLRTPSRGPTLQCTFIIYLTAYEDEIRRISVSN